MKKLILTFLVAISCLPVFGGTKIISGTLNELKDVHSLPFIVNWDNAVYEKAGNLNDFLDKAVRNTNWEDESLAYLFQKVNSKTGQYGIRFVGGNEAKEAEYRFEMIVTNISKSGHIKGDIRLINVSNNEAVAVLTFSSDDADDNDKIAFRDQFKSIGDSLGKLIEKTLKQMYKQ